MKSNLRKRVEIKVEMKVRGQPFDAAQGQPLYRKEEKIATIDFDTPACAGRDQHRRERWIVPQSGISLRDDLGASE